MERMLCRSASPTLQPGTTDRDHQSLNSPPTQLPFLLSPLTLAVVAESCHWIAAQSCWSHWTSDRRCSETRTHATGSHQLCLVVIGWRCWDERGRHSQ